MEIEEAAFIDSECPHCQGIIAYPEACAGTVQICPNCHGEIVVPRASGAPSRPIPLPFSTPRLVVRRLAPGDWKDLLDYYADETLFQFDFRNPLEEEEILDWLDRDPQRMLSQPGEGITLGLVDQKSEKLIGDVGLRLSDAQHQQASLSVCIHPGLHRQGFASEALAGMLVFCFREIGLRRVTATCDSRNAAALGLFAKVGLRREGEFVKNQLVKGQWINTVWFAMLNEEYSQRVKQP